MDHKSFFVQESLVGFLHFFVFGRIVPIRLHEGK